jgi:hypothetical protein
MHGWTMARWTPSSLISFQQYMIIAMQRLDKHHAIRTCNNRRYVIVADVITRYYEIALVNKNIGVFYAVRAGWVVG